MKKKIMLLSPSLLSGGGEKLVYDLALSINKEAYDVVVVLLHNTDCFDRIKKLGSNGIKVLTLADRGTRNNSFCMLRKMKSILKEQSPDVVHSHLDTILYLAPFANKKTQYLHTVHSIADFEARGWRRAIRYVLFKSRRVCPVAIGENVKESIVRLYGIKSSDVAVVENGVRLYSNAEKIFNEDDTFRFVSVGSMSSIKNQQLLIRAFARICHETERELSLTLIGDGPLKKEYKDLAENLGISDKVSLPGLQDDVYNAMSCADAYVCPSLIEGISLSIIEAMSCGLPIIASDVGGNPELIKDGLNGFLFKSNDEENLQKKMIHLITMTKEEYHTMSVRSKNESRKYDIYECARKYEEQYSKVQSK